MLEATTRSEKRPALFAGETNGSQCAVQAPIRTGGNTPQSIVMRDARSVADFFGGDPFWFDGDRSVVCGQAGIAATALFQARVALRCTMRGLSINPAVCSPSNQIGKRTARCGAPAVNDELSTRRVG